MSEVQVAEPVRSVTVNGITATSAMTGTEIFNAHLKAQGGTPSAKPESATGAPPTSYQTGATQQRIAQIERENGSTATAGTIAGKAPPPTPKVLEKQNATDKVAQFDAEMRAQGKQIAPGTGTPSTDPIAVDQAGIDKLSAQYQTLMRDLEPAAAKTVNGQKTLDDIRAQYRAELKEFYEGRRLGETRKQFWARRDGTAPAAPSGAPVLDGPRVQTWNTHVVDGQVDLDKITLDDTGGYTLTRFKPNQTFRVEAFEMLRQAKAAGFTQAQVDAYLRQEAVKLGWVKA